MDKLTVNKAFVITALQDYLNDKYLRKSVTINNIELVDNINSAIALKGTSFINIHR